MRHRGRGVEVVGFLIFLTPETQWLSDTTCPSHNSSLQSWDWIIFHIIVVHDPMVSHDLDPRSYL